MLTVIDLTELKIPRPNLSYIDNLSAEEATKLLITKLAVIQKTMFESPQARLAMLNWVGSKEAHADVAATLANSKDTTYSSCGFAACVCGDQALKGDLDSFSLPVLANGYKAVTFEDYAANISTHLEKLATTALGTIGECLIQSIVYADAYKRLDFASRADIPTTETYCGLNPRVYTKHLTAQYPTPADAACYIGAVIAKIHELTKAQDNE